MLFPLPAECVAQWPPGPNDVPGRFHRAPLSQLIQLLAEQTRDLQGKPYIFGGFGSGLAALPPLRTIRLERRPVRYREAPVGCRR